MEMNEQTNSHLRMLNVTPLASAYVIRQIEADHTLGGIQESLKEMGLERPRICEHRPNALARQGEERPRGCAR
jgi:hypothetical protein